MSFIFYILYHMSLPSLVCLPVVAVAASRAFFSKSTDSACRLAVAATLNRGQFQLSTRSRVATFNAVSIQKSRLKKDVPQTFSVADLLQSRNAKASSTGLEVCSQGHQGTKVSDHACP